MFFFDVTDGYGPSWDDTGLEMPSAEAARQEAIASLWSIGQDRVARLSPVISIGVRNGVGNVVFTASLSLNITVQHDEQDIDRQEHLAGSEARILSLDAVGWATAQGWQAGRDAKSFAGDCPYSNFLAPLRQAWLDGFSVGRAS